MDKVLELNKVGFSQRDIAEETGLSLATINRRLQEAREKGLFDESSDEAMDKVLELRKQGLSQRDIAKETGLGLGAINRKLQEAKEKGLLDDVPFVSRFTP